MKQQNKIKFDLDSYKAISHAISTYEDMRLLLQHLVEGICRTFDIKGSSILLFDESERQLFRVSSHGLSDNYISKGDLFLDEEFKEFQQGKIVISDNLKVDSRIKYAEAASAEGIEAIISIPIKFKNHVVGLLKNYHGNKIMPHEEDMNSISVLMQQLGLVIQLNGLCNFISTIRMAVDNLPSHVICESF